MSEDAPKRILRVLVPLLVLIGGVVVAFSISSSVQRTKPGSSPTAGAAKTAAPGTDPAPANPGQDPAPATPGATPASTSNPGPAPAPAAPIAGLFVRPVPYSGYAMLGSLTPKDQGGTDELRLTFSPFGAGVEALELANHYTTIKKTEHEVVQRHYTPPPPADQRLGAVPFAAERIQINGTSVVTALDPRETSGATAFWRELGPGSFEAIVADGTGADVVRLRRTYEVRPGSYEFVIRQSVENLTGSALSVVWEQFGPVDLPLGTVRYGGDVRRVRFGYITDPKLNPGRVVEASKFLISHSDALGKQENGVWPAKVLWPNPQSVDRNLTLAWTAMTSRYFAVGVHQPVEPGPAGATPGAAPGPVDATFLSTQRVERFSMPATPDPTHPARGVEGYVVLRLVSPELSVPAGGKADVSVAAYAGPMSRVYLDQEPRAAAVGLPEVVIYTFGGPCAICTFQTVTWLLRSFLGVLHDYVFQDWALSIMLLVVCVRSLLHPVTRWSQLSLMRFGKQMQALGPKQKAIQEKYKDDPKKLREEIGRLMREENIQYTGALGCLPMFLQMPVWIALYATIYFTFELRHEPAFYGLFQSLTNNQWAFLGDLAEPDHFLSFGHSFYVPLLSSIMGPIEALNLLPLILGVVFYIQQKYMTPPTSATMTPEMEAQQKMMKVMTVVMFPLFMYNAPAGLSLYFMVNSSLAIVETRWIRAHGAKQEEARSARLAAGIGTSIPNRSNPASKAKGFFARIQERVEQQQKLMEKSRQQQARQQVKNTKSRKK